MKKAVLLPALIILGLIAKANDLIVEENGLAPSYSTIASAVAAANSGDRIFIKNKAGNLPWLENITLTKTISLLAFQYDSFFVVQGSYTITPTSSDTTTIIGMINLNGEIGTNASAPGATRSAVRIFDTQLNNGSIFFGFSNWDLTMQGCLLSDGYINYAHGSIIGNTIGGSTYGISVTPESVATTDTSYIFGNKITSSSYGIYWTTGTMYFDIRNNYILATEYGIYLSPISSGASINKVYNNTINMTYYPGGGTFGIFVSGSGDVDVQNNVVDRTNTYSGYTYYGIYVSTSTGTVSYNYLGNTNTYGVGGSPTVNLNNSTASITVAGNGSTTTGVNGGNPGAAFYDTDLTVNDAGCFGGSYTLNNYPQFGIYPTTWMNTYQFNVRTGNTLSVKANSYSR